jgi:hypothetical protein
MQPELIIALLLALPITILMAFFIWYLNLGGLYTMIKTARRKRPLALKATFESLSSTINGVYPTRLGKQKVD